MPQTRVIFHPKKTNGNSTSAAASIIQRSMSKNRWSTGIAPNMLATPMMPNRLKMLDPITLPSATSACRRVAAMIVVASSGKDVPTATKLRPITVDVWFFHYLKNLTSGKKLWLRNNLSTMASQLIDTLIYQFTWVLATDLTFVQAFGISVAKYVIKVFIALIDTIFIYWVRNWEVKS